MSARYFSLTPQDAWFFRDGRPYNHGESNQSDVESVFPPPARTLTGALRAALARANGWDGRTGSWPENVTQAFGDGVNDLGSLQFTGPFLLHANSDVCANHKKSLQPLWPLPLHLLGKTESGKWTPKTFLRPANDEVETDQGKLRLPEIVNKSDGLKPAENAWITVSGLEQILKSEIPSAKSIFHPSQLWKHESRVGLQRDATTRCVGEGDLYSPSYVRLHRRVALGIGINEIPENMNDHLPDLFPLGGESRLAVCDLLTANPLPSVPNDFKPNTEGLVKFTVIQLTPARFEKLESCLPYATVVSACVGKPIYIGGWDSLKREPLPLEPFYPAGSVWFCTAPVEIFQQQIQSQSAHRFGDYIKHGFGQILIGHWPR